MCSLMVLSFVAVTSFLAAEVEYDIQDIDTLHTRASEAVAINNQGQILGWYSIDGTKEGKKYFVRERDGSFYEILEDPSVVYKNISGPRPTTRIDWRYLTDDRKAYGTLTLTNANPILFMWDRQNGLVNLGNLPGKEVTAINNAGQVLIKSVNDTDPYGKSVKYPVIWQNGKITKLRGLEGDLGIESEESYGFDMNNKGAVVGQSVAYLSYKNDIYKQVHAVKWINGQAIDLHRKIPKTPSSSAIAINDLGDVIISNFLLRADGEVLNNYLFSNSKASDTKYFINEQYGNVCVDRFNKEIYIGSIINDIFSKNYDSIWMYLIKIVGINDNGEIIAQGKTIYGEEHAMLLTPVKPK